MKQREIEAGKIYLPRKSSRRKFRRVVAVMDGRVCYSSGGDRNLWCSLGAFKRATKPEPVAHCVISINDLLSGA